jgi:hypothetical protein
MMMMMMAMMKNVDGTEDESDTVDRRRRRCRRLDQTGIDDIDVDIDPYADEEENDEFNLGSLVGIPYSYYSLVDDR